MARKTRVTMSVDALESRLLLSGITYTLTTDQTTYPTGQAIRISFIETNSGDEPVTVEH